jgi:hypothetical protein
LTKTPKPKTKESEIQSQLEHYLRLKGVEFLRFPDSLYRYIFANPQIPIHVKKQCSDFMKGVPDLTILVKSGSYAMALQLEVKTNDGKLTQGQKNYAKHLNVYTGYGFDECKEIIDTFLRFADLCQT